MASKTYTQKYADGTSAVVRRSKLQGAPKKPDSLRRTRTIVVHVTESEYTKFLEAKNMWFLSASNFASLVMGLGLTRLSESNN